MARKKGGKKKKGGVKSRSVGGTKKQLRRQEQAKIQAEAEERLRLGLTGGQPLIRVERVYKHGEAHPKHCYIPPENAPQIPERVKEAQKIRDGIRILPKNQVWITMDEIGIENSLIKWRPIHVENPITNVVAILSETDQLVWEKPVRIKYFRREKCFILIGCSPDLLEMPPPENQLPGIPTQNKYPRPITHRLNPKKHEVRLKHYLTSRCGLERLDPISLVVFDLPDQIWQLQEPEMYGIGLDSYVFFGEFAVRVKTNQPNQQNKEAQAEIGTDQPDEMYQADGMTWEEAQQKELIDYGLEFDQMAREINQNVPVGWVDHDPLRDQVPSSLSRTSELTAEQAGFSQSEGTGKTNCPVEDRTRYCSLGSGGKINFPPASEIQMVMSETRCTAPEAMTALKASGGDLVGAILHLTC